MGKSKMNETLDVYKYMVEAINRSQAVIEFNLDGTIITANNKFLNAMGYTLDEVQGQHHSLFVEPEYKASDEYRAFWDKLQRGEFESGEFKRIGKGGREVWIDACYMPVLDDSGTPLKVVKFASDHTAKKLEHADVDGQLAAISKAQAVIEFNLDGTIINANANFLATVGYSLEEIRGQHHSLFVESQERESYEYKAFWEQLARGEYDAGEYKRIGKDGKEIWIQASYNPIFDMNGRPFKVVKYATDITATKLQAADYSGQINAIGKSQAVIEFNLDGTILSANENFLAAVGYSLEEIEGQHHRMFVTSEERNSPKYRAFWEKLARGEYDAGEYKRIAKGGREIWIQASYNPILDMSGKPFKVVKYASDITAAKQQNADFSGQIDAIGKSLAVIEFNLDGTIRNANENFLATVGYRLDDIQGQHHSMFMEPAERNSSAYQMFWAKLARGEYDAGVYKRIGQGGKEIWIQASYNPILDMNGKPFKVVKYATDVTESKLRNADYSGQIAAIGKSQAVIEFNLDGTILNANDNFLAATGYRLDEIQGRHHNMFVEPEYKHSPEYREFWEKLNRGEYDTGEYKRIAKGGREIWIQASYNPILDLNGKPFKVVKYATDVTGRKQAVAEIKAKLLAVADGDLTASISAPLEDEFIVLGEAMNALITKLNDMVAQIRGASSNVFSASSEIAQGNLDLSNRTESQASNLEETASAMEELTATVKQNADNASDATQKANEAMDKATKGGDVISSAVQAMDAINRSSKKIADIIGVIDEISFQTNILALNAAVEAARAGEQGRGFAVVAAEVRNLAQRSAGAAKEIKGLISDSISAVENGSELVNATGTTFTELVDSVQDVVARISEIDTASREQSIGITEVSRAVSQMEEMTQQNAALVEQASASSKSMEDQAESLLQQVGFFKVAGASVSYASRAPEPQALPAPQQYRRRSPEPQPVHSSADEWEEF